MPFGFHLAGCFPQFHINALSAAGTAAPEEVLDVACGHGRYSEILADRGYTVTGIDISDTLIDHLNRLYKAKIRFLRMPMEEIPWKDHFGLLFVLGNSLSLIPEEAAVQAAKRFCVALKPGGKAFLELDNKAYYLMHEAGTRDWSAASDRYILLSEYKFREADSTELSRDIVIDTLSETAEEYLLVKRLYSPEEITVLLQEAGFSILNIFGGWDGSDYREDAPQMLFLLEKPG